VGLAAGCTAVRGPFDEFRASDDPIPVATPYEIAERFIGAADVPRHIRFLASDARRGRATGSAGMERAAAWLAAEFRKAGLEPAGDPDGYLQYWPYDDGRIGGADTGSSVPVPNVVGRVAGSDSTRQDEYVLVVAHFDHLGVGEPNGDSIYNGADDNASGLAALVEVSKAVGALSGIVERSVLFLAVSGGEEGRLGSRWFVDHPTVPLAGVVAVLDLDMIGRNHPESIGVLGSTDRLAPLIRGIADDTPALRLTVVDDPPGADRARDGDYAVFAERGIPAVRFFAGLHDDYHTTSDEPGTVDADKVTRVARLVFLTVHYLATGT
jgi:aminopeptidase N